MKTIAVFFACLVMAGCASQHTISASTPRSVEVRGMALTSEDQQKAFDVAQSECSKYKRHAALARNTGTKLEGRWLFDCVQ